MNKTLCLGVAAALPLCAAAQSTITLYGRLDVSVNFQQFDKTATKPTQHVTTVSNDTSWWGLRGVEDLGGGNRAYFKIESGYQIDTGAQSSPSSIFNRETYVGLGSERFGAVQAGSQFSPSIAMSAKVDPFIRQNVGAQFTLLQGLRGYVVQYQNAVQYVSPVVYGFAARVLASAGEGAATGPSYSGQLEFAQGPAYVGITYDQLKIAAASVALAGAPVQSQTWSMGAAYELKGVKLGGWYQVNHVDRLADVKGFMVGLTLPVTELSNIRTSYAHREQLNADAGLAAIGYFYKFSKRTEVYTAAARLKNSGTAAFGIWPGSQDVAAQGKPGPGRRVSAMQVGMRHVF